MSARASLLANARAMIPPLLPEFHKGQAGRVGIVGGSRDYTGAPFYVSMASMRLGSDMAFTVCAPEAALAIKSYSPDMIVQPVLDAARDAADVRAELRTLFARLHSVVVGPGLGREPHMQTFAAVAIEVARELHLNLVVDADGLWLVHNRPEVVHGYRRAVLTPNVVELARLCKSLHVEEPESPSALPRLSDALGGVTVLAKGGTDRIASPAGTAECDEPGSLKRCGGQGDLLSGSLGTMMAWAKRYEERSADGPVLGVDGRAHPPLAPERLPLIAAWAASALARHVSHAGFMRLGRSMLADDLLGDIGPAYENMRPASRASRGEAAERK
ncbi:ATP-dependent NAD(P)H-hydrate dehydratase [Malassezia sp. CBS 17886]|nr:ATP-dependent NAD(P)H-hydrate dehydratase [Malassezia sp. CBS 17886]